MDVIMTTENTTLKIGEIVHEGGEVIVIRFKDWEGKTRLLAVES